MGLGVGFMWLKPTSKNHHMLRRQYVCLCGLPASKSQRSDRKQWRPRTSHRMTKGKEDEGRCPWHDKSIRPTPCIIANPQPFIVIEGRWMIWERQSSGDGRAPESSSEAEKCHSRGTGLDREKVTTWILGLLGWRNKHAHQRQEIHNDLKNKGLGQRNNPRFSSINKGL